MPSSVFKLIIGIVFCGNLSLSAQTTAGGKACADLQGMLDSLQREVWQGRHHALADWLQFYGISASAAAFQPPAISRTENRATGNFTLDGVDVSTLAVSPDRQNALSYEGYYIDLSETPEDQIGFDDSHNIELYNFSDSSIHRIHFKGISQSTDELFWLDNHRFMLLGATHAGQANGWVPYIQVTDLSDSSSCTYHYGETIKDVKPFDYLLQRLRKKQASGSGLLSGFFEGTEPFWDIEIKDNKFVLHCINDTETGLIFLAKKQTHTATYAFSGKHIFGIIRESTGGGCDLDITEKENPTHEIYFSYKNATYMGCGWLTKP
ncbi:hypothetical protein [Parapedobacter sp.]